MMIIAFVIGTAFGVTLMNVINGSKVDVEPASMAGKINVGNLQ